MTTSLAQFGWLAQGPGIDDWANILFIVIMAVLWLLAGLVKAISKKAPQPGQPEAEGPTGPQRPGESWQQRLARRAEQLQRRLEEEAGVREPHKRPVPGRERPARPSQAAGGRIATRPGQRSESAKIYERPEPQPPARIEPRTTEPYVVKTLPTEPRIETGPLGPIVAGMSPQPPELDQVQPGTSPESGGFELAAILDAHDPDALKKAVLHYEILGKPLALRDTTDPTAAF